MLCTLPDAHTRIQTGPVVRYGGKAAVCEASLRTQPIFEQFHILRLTQSIRQAADPEFSSFLDGIGDDYVNDKVDLGRFKHTQRVGDVIDAVFPHEVMANPEACIRRAILSPFNDFVDELNEELLARIPGEEQHYYSTDSIEDEDGHPVNVAENPLATPDFLNAQTEPGTPPHDLNFKIGAIVRFVRNFSQKQGVTKNTRGIVRRLHRYSIEVETLPMTVAGQIVDSVSALCWTLCK
jgi:ATP-dependent DNA helicase PIF1